MIKVEYINLSNQLQLMHQIPNLSIIYACTEFEFNIQVQNRNNKQKKELVINIINKLSVLLNT